MERNANLTPEKSCFFGVPENQVLPNSSIVLWNSRWILQNKQTGTRPFHCNIKATPPRAKTGEGGNQMILGGSHQTEP